MRHPRRALAFALVIMSLVALLPGVSAANDAGTGADAGATFESATSVIPTGRYNGALSTDDQDWFRFWMPAGVAIDIDVTAGLLVGVLAPGADNDKRLGVNLYDPNGVLLDNPNSNIADSRVTWPRTLFAGEYRLSFDAKYLGARSYSFCFVITGDTCATVSLQPIGLLTPLPVTLATVLLVPPVGLNPGGSELPPDYLAAALAGIRAWDPAIDAFTAKYPEYSYLQQLKAHVDVFDGAPLRAGYDVIIVWAPYTGPIFRGLASDSTGGGVICGPLCNSPSGMARYSLIEPYIHQGTRLIVMSAFAAAPRAGQVVPDFPEEADVYNVMLHEFAHTWGLGHTTTWTADHGPDLMNSPYALTFGDGDPLGDGGERTTPECISSLDLYGMARLYEWLGQGETWDQRNRQLRSASLPSGMPYELFCV